MANGGYSNLVFKQRAGAAKLPEQDTAFAAAVFYGALERQITLDYALAKFIEKPLEKLDAEVLAILRSGFYQCLFMDGVPASAAVNESVKLCRALKKSSAAGFVNAVLRKAASVDLQAEIDEISDPVSQRSVRYSLHPDIVALLQTQYGAQSEPIMAGLFTPRRRIVRVNTLKTDTNTLTEVLKQQGIDAVPAPLPDALEIRAGRYLESRAFREGLFRPQSLAAQRAVFALEPAGGQLVYDLCAAPGGKTLTAAQLMKNSGTILAFDKSESRLALVEKQAALEGVDIVETRAADTSATMGDYVLADRVLCDVPCSGLGEISAKPELRAKPLDSIGELPVLQQKILRNGAALLKPGGRLVYSTCTFNKTENIGVVDGFLAQNNDFALVAPKMPVEGDLFVDKTVNFLPNDRDPEGFFIATFERVC